MKAEQWFTEFDRRGDEFRAARAAFHREVGERIRAESAPALRAPVRPVVLERDELDDLTDFDDDALDLPASVRRTWTAALSTGWAVRVVRALAAVPGKGLVESWSVRARRHDERLAAVWVSGGFDAGYYVRPDVGMEMLGWETLGGRARAMAKAATEGKKIPAALRVRGVLDAINGVRLT